MTIYVVRDPKTDAVKIGYTKRSDPGRRISDLQLSTPRKLRQEWYGAGTRDDEAALHRYLRHARVSGEWFDGNDSAVRLALVLLPMLGIGGLLATSYEQLATFVPIAEPFKPWLINEGEEYWPAHRSYLECRSPLAQKRYG